VLGRRKLLLPARSEILAFGERYPSTLHAAGRLCCALSPYSTNSCKAMRSET
jgi:hypothetical protein